MAVGKLNRRPVVVSGGDNGTVRVWDLAHSQPIGEPLRGHQGEVSAVAVAELDGRPVIISGSWDTTVRVWDLASGRSVGEPQHAQQDTARLDPATDRQIGRLYSPQVRAAARLNGRPVTISGGEGDMVRIWDYHSGEPVGEPLYTDQGQISVITEAEVDGCPVVFCGGVDGTVWVWDLASGQPLEEPLRGHRGVVSSVAAAEVDGRFVIVSGGEDGTVWVWDLATGRSLGRIEVGSVVKAVSLTVDGICLIGTRMGRVVVDLRNLVQYPD